MPPKEARRCSISSTSLADFLLGQALEVATRLTGLELIEEGDALLDGDEVGQHATEPAAVDVGLAGSGGLLKDRLLGLLLGPDEEDAVAAGGNSRAAARARSSRLTVWARSMMWIPLRSAKMNGFILGFQRRVWWPKWTPASSS
jgi:hypothetical protein